MCVNSKLFLEVVNGRRRRNYIMELESEDELIIRGQDEIAKEISSFFKEVV